jgi:hypothetical protein
MLEEKKYDFQITGLKMSGSDGMGVMRVVR